MSASTEHCRYHSRLMPSWCCEACELLLCSTCIPGGDENFRPGQPRCPDCLASLKYLGEGQAVLPFWQAAPQLFRYAAHPMLLGTALLAALLGNLFFLADLFFFVVLIRYGLMIVSRIAYGDMTPPEIGAAMSGKLDLFFKQLLVLAVMFSLPVAVGLVSRNLGWGLLVLVTLSVPASVMSLALTESVRNALNPLLWMRLIWTVGWSYLLLWLAWSSVTAVPGLVAATNVAPAWKPMVSFVADFLSFYTSILGYAMMGYLLYQHGRELGLAQHGKRGRSLAPDTYVRKEVLGLSHILAQQGRLDEALECLDRGLRHASSDLELLQRKFLILRLDPDRPRFVSFCERYLTLLHSEQQLVLLANTWLDIRALRAGYTPADPDIRVAIARVMVERGRWPEAKRLLVNLHSSDPAFAGLAEAYLLLARVYLEGLGNTASAAKVLGFLKTRFPEQLASGEGRELLGLYQRLKTVS